MTYEEANKSLGLFAEIMLKTQMDTMKKLEPERMQAYALIFSASIIADAIQKLSKVQGNSVTVAVKDIKKGELDTPVSWD